MLKKPKSNLSFATKSAALGLVTAICLIAVFLTIVHPKSYSRHQPKPLVGKDHDSQLTAELGKVRLGSPKLITDELAIGKSILKKLDYPVENYLHILQNSVKLIKPPASATPTLKQARRDCKRYPKQSLMEHQHSLELRFPQILHQMHHLAELHHRPEFSLLWRNNSAEPLFYYLESQQYYVVHCSYKRRDKESWDKGNTYINELSEYIVHHSPEFQQNLGVDFLVPASHPKSGPFGVKTHTISAYQRQTFLRTDFDFTGHAPRDIIVPYYVPSTSTAPSGRDNVVQGGAEIALPRHQEDRSDKLLLFFAGGRNPPGGIREQLETAMARTIQREGIQDVTFTTSAISAEEYERGLRSSVFCASMRGDTATSARLFASIQAGCIPVLISDWLPLPFESIIDYRKFTLRFPESIVHNTSQLIAHLRTYRAQQIHTMREALRVAKQMLIFPSVEAPVYSLLNPVSLTLVEMFLRRKQYCDALSTHHSGNMESLQTESESGDHASMCYKLYGRLKAIVHNMK
jgi:hypothetical protein